MPLNNLGDLILTAGADLSGVDKALNQDLPNMARQAAANIDAALGNLNIGTGLESQLQKVTTPLSTVVANTQNLGNAAEQTAPSVTHMMEAFLGADAIEHALRSIWDAIKDLAVVSVEEFAQMERFQVEMTRLTGSSEEATRALGEMKTLAASKPFEFEELAKAEQRMTAFGIATGEITRTMRAAMDAAAATGNSFTLISNALERVEVTGSINARQLNQLGVSWEELAKNAGRSVQELQEAVKKGGEGAAYDMELLVKTIESKFSGAADALGQTLQGQFQIMKNQITLTLGGLGEALAPSLRELMKLFQDELLPAVQHDIDGFKELAPALGVVAGALHVFVGEASQVVTAIGNVEQAIGAMSKAMRDDADMAVATLKTAIVGLGGEASTFDTLSDNAGFFVEKVKELGSLSGQINIIAASFQTFGLNATQALKDAGFELSKLTDQIKHYADTHVSAMGQVRMGWRDSNDALIEARKLYEDIKNNALIPATEKTAELAKQQEVINKLWREADPASYAAQVRGLKDAHEMAAKAVKTQQQEYDDFAKSVHDATEAANKLALQISDISGKDKEATDQITGDAAGWIAAMQRRAAATEDLDHATLRSFREMVQSQKELVISNETVAASLRHLDEPLNDLGDTFVNTMRDGSQSLARVEEITVSLKDRIPEVIIAFAQMSGQMHEAGMRTVQDYDASIARLQSTIRLMHETNQPLAQQEVIQERLLALETQRAIATGNTGLAIQKQLAQISAQWGQTAQIAVQATQQMANAVAGDLGTALHDIITGTGHVGEAFDKLGLDILRIIEEVVIKELLRMIFELTIVKTLMRAVFGFFFSGGGVVPGLGGGMLEGYAGGGVAHAAGGWEVPGFGRGDTVPAMLTPGEMVLPVDISEGLQSVIKSGSLNGGASIHIENLNVTIPDAGNPQQTAREIATYLKGLSRSFTARK